MVPLLVVGAVFAIPFWELMRYAWGEKLHSHIVLIPLIVGYLIHGKWGSVVGAGSRWAVGPALVFFVASAAVYVGGRVAALSPNDHHSASAAAIVLALVGGGFLSFGTTGMRALAFPFGFLVFLIPLPDAVAHGMENYLVLASAEATYILFELTGTPYFRTGSIFQLPGITIEVARECSGIRSTWVLFITSVLASHLLLETPWRRVVLVLFIIPLGIVRNGFRILTISLLCVHIGPHMIDSPIHHRGGPIFFGLSLIPLFALLWWLRRGEGGREGRMRNEE